MSKPIAEMSFREYLALTENTVTPPSGQTVGQQTAKPTTSPSQQSKMWSNPNAPITPGMTVGVKSSGNQVTPMQVSQVDQNADGVKVKDPTTGKDQWFNREQLATMGMAEGSDLEETDELARILELAGVAESASAGASCAGAIASAPTAMGKMRQRSEESVSLDQEHKRDTPYQSIVGDTKPAQATGKLSADLAASGKATANRLPRR